MNEVELLEFAVRQGRKVSRDWEWIDWVNILHKARKHSIWFWSMGSPRVYSTYQKIRNTHSIWALKTWADHRTAAMELGSLTAIQMIQPQMIKVKWLCKIGTEIMTVWSTWQCRLLSHIKLWRYLIEPRGSRKLPKILFNLYSQNIRRLWEMTQ